MAKSDPKQQDPLDAFDAIANEDGDLTEALMLILWKDRHDNPAFTVNVTPEDLKGFYDCVNYLEVEPRIRVFRPAGLPAQEPVAAHGNRRAVPGRAATPPKDYVAIQMVDKDGNAFVPIENNEQDLDKAQQAAKTMRVKENAKDLANQLRAQLQQGTYSNATIEEAIVALNLLGG